MANAPPTPPATTPIELQDEARSNAAAAASAVAAAVESPQAPPPTQNVPETRPEIYQNVMPAIIDSIARHDFQRMVNIAEETEFSTAADRQPSRLFVVAPLVLGYLVLDETAPARHALVRLPENLAHLPLSRALMTLVVATTNREHAKVYDQTTTLLSLTSQPDLVDKDLSPIIAALLSAFIDNFRHRTFALLSKAYTSIPLPLACTYLGWPQDEVVGVAQKNGWSYDVSSQVFHPGASSKSALPRTAGTSFSSLNTFHFVADSVAKLEI